VISNLHPPPSLNITKQVASLFITTYYEIFTKELSLCPKEKFSNPNIFATRWMGGWGIKQEKRGSAWFCVMYATCKNKGLMNIVYFHRVSILNILSMVD